MSIHHRAAAAQIESREQTGRLARFGVPAEADWRIWHEHEKFGSTRDGCSIALRGRISVQAMLEGLHATGMVAGSGGGAPHLAGEGDPTSAQRGGSSNLFRRARETTFTRPSTR